VSKKRIIMVAAVGIVSFTGAFVVARLTKKAPASFAGEPNESKVAGLEANLEFPRPQGGALGTITADTESGFKKAMTEKQLKNLVYEVREKMQTYNDKLRSLEAWEQRLQMTQDTLKKDTENLNNLRIELASAVTSLKEQRDKLLKSQIEIAKTEKANLTSIAATYDKMDAARASEIFVSMCASKAQAGVVADKDSSMDDAVKILYYMTERTKAKLLEELVSSEPKLAAALCQKLKQIVEK
jgi:DNA repair exonuclease SbcCD ATPase subunit